MKYTFQNPVFLTTVVKPNGFPSFGTLREIAVVGRSNVGKSTLLNHLFKAKNLVKTSSVPGKTQAVNFFKLGTALIFADLPGYGYAKVPLNQQMKWGPLIESYLSTRPNLILFLLDIRRNPNQDDQKMFQWILASEIPFILVFTKTDKVKQGEKIKQTRDILHLFSTLQSSEAAKFSTKTPSLNTIPHVHYSSIKNEGRNQLIFKICEVLG